MMRKLKAEEDENKVAVEEVEVVANAGKGFRQLKSCLQKFHRKSFCPL